VNTAWAAEWLHRFSATDPTALMEMYADGVSFEDFALDRRVDGKLPARDFFAAFMNPAERKNTFTLVDYSGDDRGGAVEWIWKAEHQAEFIGLPARGKDTIVRGVSVVTFRNGKVATQHDYWDARAVTLQFAKDP
jgi:steroid delta-isomerase-like uncharacterized protein